MAITPCGLEQDVSAMTVPGLRDAAASFSFAGRVFAWNKAEVSHELSRRFEASPIDDLCREDHGTMRLEAAEALQPGRRRGERRGERERFNARIEFGATGQLVLEERE